MRIIIVVWKIEIMGNWSSTFTYYIRLACLQLFAHRIWRFLCVFSFASKAANVGNVKRTSVKERPMGREKLLLLLLTRKRERIN